MPKKSVTFLYYRPYVSSQPSEAVDLTNTFTSLQGKSHQGRVQKHYGNLIQLSSIDYKNDIWELQFAKYRTGILPEQGNPLTAEILPIEIPPGYQLTEVLFALYDPILKLFFIQQNKNAVSSNTIASFLTGFLELENDNTGAPNQLLLDLVIKPGALAEVEKLGSTKRLSVVLSNVHDPALLEATKNDRGLSQALIAAQHYVDEYEVELSYTLKVKQRKYVASLKNESLFSTVKSLFSHSDTSDTIKKIEVAGLEDEDDKNHAINLLKYRLEEKEDFEIPRGTAIPRVTIRGFMIKKYNEKKPYLERLFLRD